MYMKDGLSELIMHSYIEQGYDVSGNYLFFYDETNNNIKFQFKNGKIPNIDDFVKKYRIAGIVLKENIENYNFDVFQKELNVKPELKINLVNSQKTDTFLNCLRGKVLEKVFDFFIEQGILVHVFSFDNLYDVIIDIVDSLFSEDITETYFFLAPVMKNSLYNFVIADIDKFMNILKKYKYPNIINSNIWDFCNDMYFWIENYATTDDFGLECCRQQFKAFRKKDNLLFLNDNKENVIIDGYASINFNTCAIFANSFHLFDDISEVQEELKKFSVNNYDFGSSVDNFTLQLSDVVVGLMDRFFNYIDSKDYVALERELLSLEGRQKSNLLKFLELYYKSLNENELFFGFYEPHDIVAERNDKILKLINKFIL